MDDEEKKEGEIGSGPRVYSCRECVTDTFGGCEWSAKSGPPPTGCVTPHPPSWVEGRNPVWILETKKEFEVGPHLEAPLEVLAQLSPELQAAIKAGAPIVMFVQPERGMLKVAQTRTLEKSYAVTSKPKLSAEEITLLQTEHSHLIETWAALEERVRKADSDGQKALRQKNDLEEQLRKKRKQLSEICDGLRTLIEKYRA